MQVTKCPYFQGEGYAVLKEGKFILIRWFSEYGTEKSHSSCEEHAYEFGGEVVSIKRDLWPNKKIS